MPKKGRKKVTGISVRRREEEVLHLFREEKKGKGERKFDNITDKASLRKGEGEEGNVADLTTPAKKKKENGALQNSVWSG